MITLTEILKRHRSFRRYNRDVTIFANRQITTICMTDPTAWKNEAMPYLLLKTHLSLGPQAKELKNNPLMAQLPWQRMLQIDDLNRVISWLEWQESNGKVKKKMKTWDCNVDNTGLPFTGYPACLQFQRKMFANQAISGISEEHMQAIKALAGGVSGADEYQGVTPNFAVLEYGWQHHPLIWAYDNGKALACRLYGPSFAALVSKDSRDSMPDCADSGSRVLLPIAALKYIPESELKDVSLQQAIPDAKVQENAVIYSRLECAGACIWEMEHMAMPIQRWHQIPWKRQMREMNAFSAFQEKRHSYSLTMKTPDYLACLWSAGNFLCALNSLEGLNFGQVTEDKCVNGIQRDKLVNNGFQDTDYFTINGNAWPVKLRQFLRADSRYPLTRIRKHGHLREDPISTELIPDESMASSVPCFTSVSLDFNDSFEHQRFHGPYLGKELRDQDKLTIVEKLEHLSFASGRPWNLTEILNSYYMPMSPYPFLGGTIRYWRGVFWIGFDGGDWLVLSHNEISRLLDPGYGGLAISKAMAHSFDHQAYDKKLKFLRMRVVTPRGQSDSRIEVIYPDGSQTADRIDNEHLRAIRQWVKSLWY